MERTEGKATTVLADFVARSRYENLPAEVVAMSKKCLLDWLGNAIGGSCEPAARHIIDFVKETGGKKQASILGVGIRTNVINAALANGTMAHVLDYDDAHNILRTHPSAPLIAALLPRGRMLQGHRP